MITVIPNWHPILVHFTIGLLSISVVFYFAVKVLPNDHRWKEQWHHMANWSLWTGCLFTVATVIAGWYAYNTVEHDSASHAAMTLHRNWALPTAALFLLVGISVVVLNKTHKKPGLLFLSVSAVAGIMLMVTGWLGAEAVYRYGIGVMSLPTIETETDGHDHSRSTTVETDNNDHHNDASIDIQQHPHGSEHAHDIQPSTENEHEH
ncbi:MAG: DUF2231 domain-containing protein [Gammaproteobacteria bacterium]|nr:DUF2231 domain-containing protein [Gammaproteobacteria bacterium]